MVSVGASVESNLMKLSEYASRKPIGMETSSNAPFDGALSHNAGAGVDGTAAIPGKCSLLRFICFAFAALGAARWFSFLASD